MENQLTAAQCLQAGRAFAQAYVSAYNLFSVLYFISLFFLIWWCVLSSALLTHSFVFDAEL